MLILSKLERLENWRDRDPEWRRWFAWHPIYTDDGTVWLEYIHRMRWVSYSSLFKHHKEYLYRRIKETKQGK